MQNGIGRAALTGGLLIALTLVACGIVEKDVPPARQTAPRETRGVTAERAMLQERSVPSARAAHIERWNEAAGHPRILVLFDRRFRGDEQQWMSTRRVVLSGQVAGVRGRGMVRAERRQTTGAELIGAQTAARLRAALQRPLIEAGCRLVDPDAIERIAQSAASEGAAAEGTREPIDISTGAFLEEADWVMEAVPVPSPAAGPRWLLAAKVVDLSSRRILASASTAQMSRRAALPGAEGGGSGAVDLEQQAEWLLEELSRQLNEELGR